MKLLSALVIAAAACAASGAEIPAGTHVLLRMEHSITTRTAKVGDGVHLRTSVPISAGGRIVVPVGSYAQGVVSGIKRGRRPQLQIQLVTLMLPGGEVLNVSSKASSGELAPGQPASRQGLGGYAGTGPLGLAVAGAIAGGQVGARAGLGAGAAVVLISALIGQRHDVELRQGAAVDVVFDQATVLE